MSTELNPTTVALVGKDDQVAPQALDLSGKRVEDLPRYAEPAFDQLLMQPLPPEEVSKGGIILPGAKEEVTTTVSVVVAKGPDATRYDKGDWLVHAPYVGQHIQLGASKFLVFREEEVLLRLVERETA